MVTRLGIIYTFLLLSFPVGVTGGPLSYAGCMAVAVGASICGTAAILPALGFTSSGIAAGSWAATWMASMGGAVPAGSLFATLQSAGATGGAMSFTSIAGSVSGLCVALTVPLP